MFILTKKQIRPSLSVEFFSPATFPEHADELKQHMRDQYSIPGKFVDSSESISADALTKTVVTTWATEADLNEWKADPICAAFVERYNQYCSQNGIEVITEFTQSA